MLFADLTSLTCVLAHTSSRQPKAVFPERRRTATRSFGPRKRHFRRPGGHCRSFLLPVW